MPDNEQILSNVLSLWDRWNKVELKHITGQRATSIFIEANVAKQPSYRHDKYVVVPADKAPNNVVSVCKSHYIDCLIYE